MADEVRLGARKVLSRVQPLDSARTAQCQLCFLDATFLELEENPLIARCLCNVSGASRLVRSLHQQCNEGRSDGFIRRSGDPIDTSDCNQRGGAAAAVAARVPQMRSAVACDGMRVLAV